MVVGPARSPSAAAAVGFLSPAPLGYSGGWARGAGARASLTAVAAAAAAAARHRAGGGGQRVGGGGGEEGGGEEGGAAHPAAAGMPTKANYRWGLGGRHATD